MEEQKYHKGDQVRVVNIGSPIWEVENGTHKYYDRVPEAIGQVGTIVGSYDDLFPNKYNANTGLPHYEIEWPEGVNLYVAWWYEHQLEPADVNTPRDQQKQYPPWTESNFAKELKKTANDIREKWMWGITANKKEDGTTE